MLCNSTLFNSKPSLPLLSSPNSPSLKHFQIHLQLLPTLPLLPENMHQRIFFHGASKKGEGMLLLQYFTLHRRANGAKSIITSSCWEIEAWLIRVQNVHVKLTYITFVWFWGIYFRPWVPWAKDPKLSHDHFYCDSLLLPDDVCVTSIGSGGPRRTVCTLGKNNSNSDHTLKTL